MKKTELERAIEMLEIKKAALQAAIDELRTHQRAKTPRPSRPRAVPAEARQA